jgi:hypothetical protein
MLSKLNVLMNMDLCKGITYCHAAKKKIQLAKELFVLEVENSI